MMVNAYVNSTTPIGISEETKKLLEEVPYGIALICNSPKLTTLQTVLDPAGEQFEAHQRYVSFCTACPKYSKGTMMGGDR